MANQINETHHGGGEEGDTSFDFDKWVIKNGLQAVKGAFIERDMNTLNTINMVDNKNFAALMSDYRVLQNTDLIPKIINAIQSLEALRKKENTTKLVYMSKNENMVLQRIQKYVKNMDQLNDELKEMNDEYDNKKLDNNNKINEYQNACTAQLNNISNIITQNVGKLHEVVTKKESLLKSKVNAYKQEVDNVKLKEDQTVKELDETLNKLHKTINTEKQHFEEEIILCENVIKQHGGNYDENNDNKRQKELEKIGNETKEYYNTKVKEIDESKAKIKQFLDGQVVNNDQKEVVYSVKINEEIFDDLQNDIHRYIVLRSKNENNEQNEVMSKSKKISDLVAEIASIQSTLKQTNDEKERTKTENQSLHQQLQSNDARSREKISALEVKIQQLTNGNVVKTKIIKETNSKNKQLQSTIDNNGEIITQLQQHNEGLQHLMKKQKQENASLKTQLNALTEEKEQQEQHELKKYLQKNNCFNKDLLAVLSDHGVHKRDDIPIIQTNMEWCTITREVRVLQRGKLKDQAAKLKAEKQMIRFEKLWRKQTGIKRSND